MMTSHVDVGHGGGPQPVILLLPQLDPHIIESDDITKIGPNWSNGPCSVFLLLPQLND